MRNAKTAALMAMFATADRRESEEAAHLKSASAPWNRAAKPIQVDLLSLARLRQRARA